MPEETSTTEPQTVELIASGYEWICPECGHFNRTIEVTESVTCEVCKITFTVADYHHAVG